jgi:hypothetical protein
MYINPEDDVDMLSGSRFKLINVLATTSGVRGIQFIIEFLSSGVALTSGRFVISGMSKLLF